MKSNEITAGDTPLVICLVQQLLAKGEKVMIDCLLQSEAGPDIGLPGPGNKVKPERIKGTVFEVHLARKIGGDGRKFSADRLFIEIEFTHAWSSVIPIWADWAEEHLKLSKVNSTWIGWKVHL